MISKDFGISRGMQYGIRAAELAGRPIEYRGLAESMNLEASLEELDKQEQYIDLGNLLF
jgi:hypothetical protein